MDLKHRIIVKSFILQSETFQFIWSLFLRITFWVFVMCRVGQQRSSQDMHAVLVEETQEFRLLRFLKRKRNLNKRFLCFIVGQSKWGLQFNSWQQWALDASWFMREHIFGKTVIILTFISYLAILVSLEVWLEFIKWRCPYCSSKHNCITSQHYKSCTCVCFTLVDASMFSGSMSVLSKPICWTAPPNSGSESQIICLITTFISRTSWVKNTQSRR